MGTKPLIQAHTVWNGRTVKCRLYNHLPTCDCLSLWLCNHDTRMCAVVRLDQGTWGKACVTGPAGVINLRSSKCGAMKQAAESQEAPG